MILITEGALSDGGVLGCIISSGVPNILLLVYVNGVDRIFETEKFVGLNYIAQVYLIIMIIQGKRPVSVNLHLKNVSQNCLVCSLTY